VFQKRKKVKKKKSEITENCDLIDNLFCFRASDEIHPRRTLLTLSVLDGLIA